METIGPRRLILMRHGEAQSGGDDFERPLTDRGHQQAMAVVRHLLDRGWHPGQTLVSAARRTVETSVALGTQTQVIPALYQASADAIVQIVTEHGVGEATIVVAHNPGLSVLASRLSGVRVSLSPSAAALLEGPSHPWPQALGQSRQWQLHDVIQGHVW